MSADVLKFPETGYELVSARLEEVEAWDEAPEAERDELGRVWSVAGSACRMATIELVVVWRDERGETTERHPLGAHEAPEDGGLLTETVAAELAALELGEGLNGLGALNIAA
jgi:hypothetical protein